MINVIKTFSRYSITGILVVSIQFTVLSFLIEWCSLYPTLSSTIAFCLATTVNYLAQKNWTFRSDMRHRHTLIRYVLVTSLALLLNSLLFWMLTEVIQMWYIYSQIIVTTTVACINFTMNQQFTFNNNLFLPWESSLQPPLE